MEAERQIFLKGERDQEAKGEAQRGRKGDENGNLDVLCTGPHSAQGK